MSGQSTPAKGTPKRLVLTPGPRPLHLGTGSFSLSSPSNLMSPLATPPTTAPLPRRMGSVSYGVRDGFRFGEEQETEKPRLARGGNLREPGGRRGRGHAPSSSVVVTGEGALEKAQRNILERKRRSASALDDQPPPALTLAEKHKDLLHFIAQKEAKCVELRAQLATHEADLLQLKKKWEKIVAKGNDRQSRSASGAVELVRGIFGLGELATPSSSHAPPTPTHSSSTSSTPGYASSPVQASSPFKSTKSPLSTASRAASRGHLSHTPQSSSSSSSTALSSVNSTRLSLSSASSLGGAELLKEKDAPEPAQMIDDDDDPDAWGPFETAQTEEPESMPESALGLSGVDSKAKTQNDGTAIQNPSWVSNAVGKKLEELRGVETFAKSTKRASTLLSDVSSALTTTLNTLAPPAPSLTKASGLGAVAHRPSPAIRLTSPRPKSSTPSPASKPSKPTPAPIYTSAPPVSLLDDDDGAGDGLGAVLQPSPSASIKTKASDVASVKTTSDAFGEDWNW